MNGHSVTLHVYDDLRRSRLTVAFRIPLCWPHFIWIFLWTLLVEIVFILNWFVALIIGRPAKPFQRFNAAYIRYTTTVFSYLFLIANLFPGFTGEPGSYPVELEVPIEPEKQNRLKTFFRPLLVVPASAVSSVLTIVIFVVAFLAWWVALITGRMPRGFRDFGAYTLRYAGEVNSYTFLVTGRYPNASPYVGISFEAPVAAEAPEAPSET